MTFQATSENIQAEGFRIISQYLHAAYDEVDTGNVTGDEAALFAIVCTTEKLLRYLEGGGADDRVWR